MSTDILPFAVWQSGTNENSIPANDNALRSEILNSLVISDSTTAQPGSPADGDIYIIPAGATGSQWATFNENDLAIYRDGTWYAYAPVDGVVVNLAGVLVRWNGSAYVAAGGSSFPTVVTETGASRDVVPGDAGTYLRFTGTGAKTATFDSAGGFSAGQEFHITNRAASGDLTLTAAGSMTLHAPKAGTLVLQPGDTVTVKMVGSAEADVMGSTEAA